jgi:hypothetical protein
VSEQSLVDGEGRPTLLRRILLGMAALLAGNVASTLTAMASSMVLARHLGVAD